jgi:hypothetical protein
MSLLISNFHYESRSLVTIEYLFLVLFVFLFSFIDTSAQAIDSTPTFTPLSGALPSLIKADNSPYVVETDIFVSPGTSVTIDSGVVLLFNNFTGLHVQGTLYAKGTKDKPIVFTSKNDSYYNPYAIINAAPYDWNGIDIYENAIGTYFDNCTVQFSVYGIRSQTEHFKISNSRFLQNGKTNISIKENILDVENAPFSYAATVSGSTPTAPAIPEITSPSTSPKNRHHEIRNILRYSGMVCALGGIATALFKIQDYTKAKDNFNTINQTSDYNKQTYSSKDWESAHKNLSNEVMILETCGGVSLLGLVAFSISFTF